MNNRRKTTETKMKKKTEGDRYKNEDGVKKNKEI